MRKGPGTMLTRLSAPRDLLARAMLTASLLTASVVCLAATASAQKPDPELRGITVVGVEVEELGSQAAACGLSRETLQSAMSKVLADNGLKVVRNTDTDTYLYVNVNTVSLPTGLCVSRYDAFLYTHVSARLPYQDQPVLVQVSLLHEGGLAGGGKAGHADNVVRNLKEYVEQFTSRIRAASQ
jgi:hypothetical protein